MIRKLLKMDAMFVFLLAAGVGSFLAAKGNAQIGRLIGPHAVTYGALLLNTTLTIMLGAFLAVAVSLPAALGLVGWLPRQTKTARVVLAVIDLGAALPAIIWGLFGFSVFCGAMGLGVSLRAGVLTLAAMLAPMLTAGFVAALRELDPGLWESGTALGLSRSAAVWHLLLPSAKPGLVATLMLGVGRGLGDAASLVFTAGVAARMAGPLLEYPGATLAVHVFNQVKTGNISDAFAAAALLFILSLLIQGAVGQLSGKRNLV